MTASDDEPPLRHITVIGHNSQIVGLVAFFVGGEMSVDVFTSEPSLEETLVIYPGVQVHLVEAGYQTAPADLAPPPYVIAVEHQEEVDRIGKWLPPTAARFLASNAMRRKKIPGYLPLRSAPEAARSEFVGRLEVLARYDTLVHMARKAKQAPMILIYGDPDPDAVGASLGLAAIWRANGIKPLLRYSGDIQRYQNRVLLQYLKEDFERLRDGEMEEHDLIAVVDCQPGFWKHAPPAARIVIDHHPLMVSTEAAEFVDVRMVGSTCSMLTEYLVEAGVAIDRTLATALFYGVSTDTDDLKRNVSSLDLHAYDVLQPKSDRHFLTRLQKSQVPMNLLDWISWGIAHRVVYNDAIVIHFGIIPTPDILVQTADLVLLTCGIHWTACAGVHDDKLVVVFRSDGHHIDVGKRAKSAFAKLGSAGGHRTMSRAEIPLKGEHVDNTVDMLINELFQRMPEHKRVTFIRTLRNHLHGAGPADHNEAILKD
jgi:nanoRNase/pAp phosphatase (c-di-AMP/oligoRNAs hydrolase)